MIRFFAVFFYLCVSLFADFHITSIKQLQDGIALGVKENIKTKDIKEFVLKSKDGLRYVYDIKGELLEGSKLFEFQDDITIRVAQNSKKKVRVVISAKEKLKVTIRAINKQVSFKISNAKAMKNVSIASLFEEGNKDTKKVIAKKPQNATTTARGKVIVIDPGHGGKDCGAVGANKVCEKKIVLNIGLYLRDILKKRGYKVYMTRANDRFISLRGRTKIANDKNADLFISIHANAIAENKHKLEGVESYFLSTARSERAKKVAALENKDDTEEMNYFSRQSFLNTLNTHRIVASNKLAIDIQYGMLQALRPKYKKVVDGGVREGPFWVLVGALMPSVLLEVGYITHPNEGKRIVQKSYQQVIAKGIADGIDGYFLKNP